jgi:hypothetical protein
MAADWFSAQEDIINRLKTATELQYVKVYDAAVPDPTALPLLASGVVAPYVAVNFAGTQDRKAEGSSGILGSAYDSATGQFQTFSVAGVPRDARRLNQIVCDLLIGYEPVGCGEISPAFFAGVMEISSQTAPTRFSAGQAFDLLVNSTNQ